MVNLFFTLYLIELIKKESVIYTDTDSVITTNNGEVIRHGEKTTKFNC